jgi:hypothetical protein
MIHELRDNALCLIVRQRAREENVVVFERSVIEFEQAVALRE